MTRRAKVVLASLRVAPSVGLRKGNRAFADRCPVAHDTGDRTLVERANVELVAGPDNLGAVVEGIHHCGLERRKLVAKIRGSV